MIIKFLKRLFKRDKTMAIFNARKTMREAFEKDRDFKGGYIANVAMMIYDDQRRDDKCRMSGPLNLQKISDCNKMAEKLLHLIFY